MTTILLVDDDVLLCRAIGRMLETMGYRVCMALSGLDAIRLGSGIEVDLVLSDIQMPGMSGHDVARAFAHRCPVVLMSGNPSAQGDRVLAKPFAHQELRERLSIALSQFV